MSRGSLLSLLAVAATACGAELDAADDLDPGDEATSADAEAEAAGRLELPRPPPLGALIVTLTFDDTYGEQFEIAGQLAGMPSTFYVNSPRVSAAGSMTAAQLDALVAAGHEIGSHTLSHPHLPQLSAEQQQAELCGDRDALVALGHDPSTIAYPFGDDSPEVRASARACGFAAARDVGGLRNADPWAAGRGYCGTAASSLDRPAAEQLPPADHFAIRSRASIRRSCTVDDLRDMVLAAASDTDELALAEPRWLVLTFHDFCADCEASLAVDPARFAELVDWLRARGGVIDVRGPDHGVIGRRPLVFRTVADVVAASPPPSPG